MPKVTPAEPARELRVANRSSDNSAAAAHNSDVKVYIKLNRARALRFLKRLRHKAPRDVPIPKSTK